MAKPTVLYDLGAIASDDLLPVAEQVAEALDRSETSVTEGLRAGRDAYERGEINQHQYWEAAALKLGLEDTGLLEDFSEPATAVDQELLGRIRVQSAGMTLGLISDATPDWVGRLRRTYQLDRLFRANIIDAELESRLPYTGLLKLAARRLQAEPAAVTFVDRKPAHLKAAGEAGMSVIDLAAGPDYAAAFADLP